MSPVTNANSPLLTPSLCRVKWFAKTPKPKIYLKKKSKIINKTTKSKKSRGMTIL